MRSVALLLLAMTMLFACSVEPVDDLTGKGRSTRADDVGEDDGEGEGEEDTTTVLDPVDVDSPTRSGATEVGEDHDGGATPACAIVDAPSAAYVRSGLHPRASDALAKIGVTATRITQTIGSATASAGTHAQDGTAEGKAYTTAVDLSVRDMTDAQVATFIDRLTEVGFVAYFRRPGYDGWPADEARHVHAIWVAAPMKASLQNQVKDWRVGKNGLASHTTYKWKTWSQCWRDSLWASFLEANPGAAS
jgi:hypothetical protein